MKRRNVIECLVISPSDVAEERQAIVDTVELWNAQVGQTTDVLINTVRWETHARPEMGDRPQAIINRQIVEGCDFAIAVFWTRLGTPTGEAESGSCEEIDLLRAKGRDVLIYACTRAIPQHLLDERQISCLRKKLAEYRKQGIVFDYQEIDQLKLLLMGHLTKLATDLNKEYLSAPVTDNRPGEAPYPKILVVASWAVMGTGPKPSDALSIAVQNHSPSRFFMKSLALELDNKKSLLPFGSALGQRIEHRQVIEPGRSADFYLDFDELFTRAREGGASVICRVVVTDEIDRRFYSTDESIAVAFSNHRTWQKGSD